MTTQEETEMTLKEAARAALDAQNACNLAGVIGAWKGAQHALIMSMSSNASGGFRRHPIQILFLSKIVSLMVVNADCIGGVYAGGSVDGGNDLFREAHGWCQDVAAKDEVCAQCGQHGVGPCGCGFQRKEG